MHRTNTTIPSTRRTAVPATGGTTEPGRRSRCGLLPAARHPAPPRTCILKAGLRTLTGERHSTDRGPALRRPRTPLSTQQRNGDVIHPSAQQQVGSPSLCDGTCLTSAALSALSALCPLPLGGRGALCLSVTQTAQGATAAPGFPGRSRRGQETCRVMLALTPPSGEPGSRSRWAVCWA